MAKENTSSNAAKDKPPKEKQSKAKAKAAEICKDKDEASGFLGKLRPRRRPIFLALFLAACAYIVAMHNGCDVPKSKRQDCGFPDITVTECKTLACLSKGGGSATVKKTIKVSRSQGQTLGLEVAKDKVIGWVTITGIGEGSVMSHNTALPADSEDRIQVGDRIAKVDSTSASSAKKADAAHEKMVKALGATDAKKVTLEVQRPRIPAALMWIRSSTGKPNTLEKMLTSPGLKQFRKTFTSVASVGLACWLVSGYPLASLPLYYGGASLAVAFHTVRCCHDENVSPGTAHCYKPTSNKFEDALEGVKTATVAIVNKFRKDPVKVLKQWFVFW
mmetsp:Transcript_109144/g.319459  ORF Transcript_109144/g.319459 Transcript_109144/m.319459 type:complete len:332 (-) Transcript_109144:133-1128(-)